MDDPTRPVSDVGRVFQRETAPVSSTVFSGFPIGCDAELKSMHMHGDFLKVKQRLLEIAIGVYCALMQGALRGGRPQRNECQGVLQAALALCPVLREEIVGRQVFITGDAWIPYCAEVVARCVLDEYWTDLSGLSCPVIGA